MPREQVEWFMEQSVNDNDKIHAQQSCSYQSIINVNKTKYPFLSSYEQEQTWTLTRTMSHNNKRYQTSIENIHLAIPLTPSKIKHMDYENMKKGNNQSVSCLPPSSPSQDYKSLSTHSQEQQQKQKNLPIQITNKGNSNSNNNSSIKRSRPLIKPMRIIHVDGEFIVRV